MKTLFLYGAGNPDGIRLARRINRLHRRWERVVVLDDDPAKHGREILGAPVEGGAEKLTNLSPDEAEVANLVARTTRRRADVRAKILALGIPFAPLMDPDVDGEGAELAPDTIVYGHATIGAETRIESGSVVFMGAVVGHEGSVGPCCVIGANAVLNARVRLEEGVYVGTNATILPEVTIGAWATIGAGSAVLQDVPAGATVVGVPGQILQLPCEPEHCECPDPLADSGARSDAAAFALDMERLVTQAWRDVLKLSDPHRERNFFDLGGTSLGALQVYEKLRSDPRIRVQLTDLFHHTSVSSLVAFLCGRTPTAETVPARRVSLRSRRTQGGS